MSSKINPAVKNRPVSCSGCVFSFSNPETVGQIQIWEAEEIALPTFHTTATAAVDLSLSLFTPQARAQATVTDDLQNRRLIG
jgi:hypothetical protein